MVKISVIKHAHISTKIVHKLLKENAVLSVAIKQIELQSREIVLVAIGDSDGNLYIFDVRTCPSIVYEGELWRILVSDTLTKVIHDCRHASAAFNKQHQLQMRNVFDTQAAFCLLMIEQHLPPRLTSLDSLYHKYGDLDLTWSGAIHEAHKVGGGLSWAQRPLPRNLIDALKVEVQVLSVLHDNLNRDLPELAHPFMEELCQMFIDGIFFKKMNYKNQPKKLQAEKSKKKPILNLSNKQHNLLYSTIPQGAQRIS